MILQMIELVSNEMLLDQEPSNHEFNTRTRTWKELQEVVRASRTSSSPGLDGVPYIVYVLCTEEFSDFYGNCFSNLGGV